MPPRLKPCITCGTPTPNTRCPQHSTGRDYQDERRRTQLLNNYRNLHGDTCQGTPWCNTPNTPHPTTDLTVDHIKRRSEGGTLDDGWRIMCRTANSRRQ